MRLVLTRVKETTRETLGYLDVYSGIVRVFSCVTLELPWRGNRRSVSCIPVGDYEVALRSSPKFKKHLHVSDVSGRSYILIHPGNFFSDTSGCILVGTSFEDINSDGEIDVVSSKKTMKALLAVVVEGIHSLKVVSHV